VDPGAGKHDAGTTIGSKRWMTPSPHTRVTRTAGVIISITAPAGERTRGEVDLRSRPRPAR